MTTLEKWLAEYPAPEPTATAPAIPTDEIEEAALFFGFKPNDLTWAYNDSNLIVAVLGGIPVWFGKLSNDNGGGFFAVVDDHGLMDTPLMLAEYIRTIQKADAKAEAYANRDCVMTVMVQTCYESGVESLREISRLCSDEGWKLFDVATAFQTEYYSTHQIFTLTRD